MFPLFTKIPYWFLREVNLYFFVSNYLSLRELSQHLQIPVKSIGYIKSEKSFFSYLPKYQSNNKIYITGGGFKFFKNFFFKFSYTNKTTIRIHKMKTFSPPSQDFNFKKLNLSLIQKNFSTLNILKFFIKKKYVWFRRKATLRVRLQNDINQKPIRFLSRPYLFTNNRIALNKSFFWEKYTLQKLFKKKLFKKKLFKKKLFKKKLFKKKLFKKKLFKKSLLFKNNYKLVSFNHMNLRFISQRLRIKKWRSRKFTKKRQLRFFYCNKYFSKYLISSQFLNFFSNKLLPLRFQSTSTLYLNKSFRRKLRYYTMLRGRIRKLPTDKIFLKFYKNRNCRYTQLSTYKLSTTHTSMGHHHRGLYYNYKKRLRHRFSKTWMKFPVLKRNNLFTEYRNYTIGLGTLDTPFSIPYSLLVNRKYPINITTVPKSISPNAFRNEFFIKTLNDFFLFENINILFINKYRSVNYKITSVKYKFKKKIFSFLFPNQINNEIKNKKKTFYMFRYFKSPEFKRKTLSKKFSWLGYTQLFKIFNIYKLKYLKQSSVWNLNHMLKINQPVQYKYNTNYHLKYGELFIKRIKFKPGYQRIWRRARLALQELLGVKFRYQYRLTKYLTKFNRLSKSYIFSISEMSLLKSIIFSKLLPDEFAVNYFLQNNFIFVNGIGATNTKYLLVRNDLIQLVVSNWFYISYRWFLNWSLMRLRKFKRLLFRKNKVKQYKIAKLKKQKSFYTPQWIRNMRIETFDVKSYLEVDYFSLSAMVLYEPFLLPQFTNDDVIDYRLITYKLYNWKYIT